VSRTSFQNDFPSSFLLLSVLCSPKGCRRVIRPSRNHPSSLVISPFLFQDPGQGLSDCRDRPSNKVPLPFELFQIPYDFLARTTSTPPTFQPILLKFLAFRADSPFAPRDTVNFPFSFLSYHQSPRFFLVMSPQSPPPQFSPPHKPPTFSLNDCRDGTLSK